jgi:Sulfotransferase family
VIDDLQVFIIGSPRSGTSITYYAMREVFGLPGRGESHVIPVFQRVIHTFFLYARDFVGSGVLAEELKTPTFRAAVVDYARNFYKSVHPNGSFVDKTPGAEAILGAILIREIFPNSRIILTRRTGTEVVQSIQRKFDTKFEDACQGWSACMKAILRIRESIEDLLEIDQFDMANSADHTALRIAEYLGQPQKAAALARFLAERRTDQRSTHCWHTRLTLPELDWPQASKEYFADVCGELMTKFGYPIRVTAGATVGTYKADKC